MLHKIKGKSLISQKSPSPSPIVLLCCFIQDIFQPLPPSYFLLVELHKFLIGMWYIPSTAVPAAVQACFVFLCPCFVESHGAAPATMRLD